MTKIDEALMETMSSIAEELEERLWQRLQPRIQDALYGRHLTVREACQYLHASDRTVRRLIEDRVIPSFRIRGKILLRLQDLDAWIEAQVQAYRLTGEEGMPES